MLFSVAILILLYFIIIQTFFQGRKSFSDSKGVLHNSADGDFNELDHGGSLFMSAIEELFDLDSEKK